MRRLNGEVIQPTAANKRSFTVLQPVGVVAAITPWNFPFSMITRKVAPALAAGCTVALKPSEETPLTAFAIAVLAQQAGVPDGAPLSRPSTRKEREQRSAQSCLSSSTEEGHALHSRRLDVTG